MEKEEKQVSGENSRNKGANIGQFLTWGIVTLVVISSITFIAIIWNKGDSADNGQILATIGGEAVTMKDIQEDYDQMKSQYASQGINLEEEENMKDTLIYQIVQNHINQRLLLDRAKEMNLIITDEQMEDEYNSIMQQFPSEEEFQSALVMAGITKETLNKNIQTSLTIQLLARQKGDTEVTQEEINNYYEELKGHLGDELPPLSEINDHLKAELTNEKMEVIIDEILKDLIEKNDVQILIEFPQPQLPPEMEIEIPEEEMIQEEVIME